jgi:hypothetical protein
VPVATIRLQAIGDMALLGLAEIVSDTARQPVLVLQRDSRGLPPMCVTAGATGSFLPLGTGSLCTHSLRDSTMRQDGPAALGGWHEQAEEGTQ